MTIRTSENINITSVSLLGAETVYQATLADATLKTCIVPAAGVLHRVESFVKTGCSGTAHAEKTEIDVTKGGVSILTAKSLINEAAGTGIVVGSLTGGTCAVVKGDKIAIVNDYTADGAGGNAGADLCVSIYYKGA